MAVPLDPFLDPPARPLQSVAGRTTLDARCALAVFFPEKLKAKIGEPPLHARMESAETKNASENGGRPFVIQ